MVVFRLNKMKKRVVIFFSVLIFLNYISWGVLFSLRGAEMEVIFIDVGQGDATLIKTPQGHRILIDGGPGEVVLEKLSRELFFYDSIDLVILTHPHYDHISGLIEVLRRYNVKNVLYTGVREDTDVFRRWEDEVDDYHLALAGMKVSANDFYIDVLYPFENLDGEYVSNANRTSIISRFVYNNYSFLFTGDAYISEERELLSRDEDLSSDVLKLGHHGSKTSTSEEFLLAVSPQVAIISAGVDNRYGHPHRDVIDLLERFNVSVMRTDRDGDIRIVVP